MRLFLGKSLHLPVVGRVIVGASQSFHPSHVLLTEGSGDGSILGVALGLLLGLFAVAVAVALIGGH